MSLEDGPSVIPYEDEEEQELAETVGEGEAGAGEAGAGEAGAGEADEGAAGEPASDLVAITGHYGPDTVNEDVFEELCLGDAVAAEVQSSWAAFLRNAETREAASEAIYAALFDAAPSLQALFATPRGVMTVRIMTGINQIITTLADPKALKSLVEIIGFQHLALEVTAPRVCIFRDALIDLLQTELGDALTPEFHQFAARLTPTDFAPRMAMANFPPRLTPGGYVPKAQAGPSDPMTAACPASVCDGVVDVKLSAKYQRASVRTTAQMLQLMASMGGSGR